MSSAGSRTSLRISLPLAPTRPARIVEVGSGHSTRFMARAVRDGSLGTQITAIDPAPRASIGGLDLQSVRQPVQACALELFESLAPGDILFVDSSHQAASGGRLNGVLGRLPLVPGAMETSLWLTKR